MLAVCPGVPFLLSLLPLKSVNVSSIYTSGLKVCLMVIDSFRRCSSSSPLVNTLVTASAIMSSMFYLTDWSSSVKALRVETVDDGACVFCVSEGDGELSCSPCTDRC